MVSPGSSNNANVSQVTDDVESPVASSTIQPRSDAAQVRPQSPPIATKRPASLRRRDASNIASSLVDDNARIDTRTSRRGSGSDPGRGARGTGPAQQRRRPPDPQRREQDGHRHDDVDPGRCAERVGGQVDQEY